MVSRRTGVWILCGLTVVVACAAMLAPRTPQPLSYHDFADQRGWLGIPNFGDVVSNAGFVVVGVWGLAVLLGKRERLTFVDPGERWAYVIVFAGMTLVAVGSSYYHWSPDNARLLWDRLPMAVVFMALVAAMITERVSVRAGLVLLPALLVVAIASVVDWEVSEMHGAGDLRFYAAVQIYAVLVLLVVLLLPPSYTRSGDLLVVVGFYVLAKLLETGDRAIFETGHLISGHTLKHLTAAAAGWWILRMLQRRKSIERSGGGQTEQVPV